MNRSHVRKKFEERPGNTAPGHAERAYDSWGPAAGGIVGAYRIPWSFQRLFQRSTYRVSIDREDSTCCGRRKNEAGGFLMARVMAEQVFNEPLSDERYAAFARKLDPCLEVRNGLWRRSSLAIDKLRMVCEFEAPDAESVREAYRASGTPCDRVWTASVYAIEDYPELMTKLRVL
ncbi:MAG: DUF4242 domain-containing protein, partial [Myxococcota bacterium]|nr:DUF4242 domain-containing protein [Myxococcota bacterium]